MFLSACMWGVCDSGLWGIAEQSDLRHGLVTCHRLTQCVCVERGGGGCCLHVPFSAFQSRVDLKALLCTGLALELSLLVQQHTKHTASCPARWRGVLLKCKSMSSVWTSDCAVNTYCRCIKEPNCICGFLPWQSCNYSVLKAQLFASDAAQRGRRLRISWLESESLLGLFSEC